MRKSVALQRYLQRHIEPDLPDCRGTAPRWQHALVIPAYRESSTLLQQLIALPGATGSENTLVILVLNRPDSDGDENANRALRTAINTLPADTGQPLVYRLNPYTELYVHDMDAAGVLHPGGQGVGLARKTGCDIALKWMTQGAINGPWIYCSDADAHLPADYFSQLADASPDAVAGVFPFTHVPGQEHDCNAATALYELRLHHYVLGLEYAASPYAYHTLGSALAVKANAYAQVRGFPKRAGGEDFYLLNKLAKLGPVTRLAGHCIELQSRQSTRVPFGTGPAVAMISQGERPQDAAVFYHPQCFSALRAVLSTMPNLQHKESAQLIKLLGELGLEQELALACHQALHSLGLEEALNHCRTQGKAPNQFMRQFHQWFDAFRSLKFIHALRDDGWPQCSLAELATLEPRLWQTDRATLWEVDSLRAISREYWGWQR